MKFDSTATNKESFYSAILQEDELGATVRAHIYIESALDQLIEILVSDYGYIKKCSSTSLKKSTSQLRWDYPKISPLHF